MRRFLVAILGLVVASWVLLSVASAVVLPILNLVGSPVAATVYFFQYYLWGTSTGNILVAASLLLVLSWVLSGLYARFVRSIVPSFGYDKQAEARVISQVLAQVGQREVQPELEAVAGTGRLRILRVITWVGTCGVLIVSWVVSSLHVSLSTGEVVGISHATLLFGALCFVMTSFFLVRLYLFQAEIQRTFREGK